jgi:hypothetical protein
VGWITDLPTTEFSDCVSDLSFDFCESDFTDQYKHNLKRDHCENYKNFSEAQSVFKVRQCEKISKPVLECETVSRDYKFWAISYAKITSLIKIKKTIRKLKKYKRKSKSCFLLAENRSPNFQLVYVKKIEFWFHYLKHKWHSLKRNEVIHLLGFFQNKKRALLVKKFGFRPARPQEKKILTKSMQVPKSFIKKLNKPHKVCCSWYSSK